MVGMSVPSEHSLTTSGGKAPLKIGQRPGIRWKRKKQKISDELGNQGWRPGV